jgi:hypothetical protein
MNISGIFMSTRKMVRSSAYARSTLGRTCRGTFSRRKPDRIKRGIGAELVRQCLKEAAELRVERVFVLTYQSGFFRKLGFADVDKKELPHKIWTDCLNCVKFPDCDESALIFTITRNAK